MHLLCPGGTSFSFRVFRFAAREETGCRRCCTGASQQHSAAGLAPPPPSHPVSPAAQLRGVHDAHSQTAPMSTTFRSPRNFRRRGSLSLSPPLQPRARVCAPSPTCRAGRRVSRKERTAGSLGKRGECLSLVFSRRSLSHTSSILPAAFSRAAVDANAGTFAAFYYKNIREFDTPTKDHMVAFGQDEKFTVGGFDVSPVSVVALSPRQ